jgi:2-polyprenyl-6-methoxyphenol hydroxylase-like FAD-dependent oxidoreductase
MADASRILIVGAGIGGLTLAHALHQRGLAFDVIELAGSWAPLGAGIGLGANALRVLDRLGLLDGVLARGRVYSTGAIADDGGAVLSRMDLSMLGLDYPPGVAIHRADLHDILRTGPWSSAIRMGLTVARIEPHPEGVEVELSDGSSATYDVVIGADGIHSSVRRLRWGDLPARYLGYTSWRTVIPLALQLEGPVELWGRGRRIGLVPLVRGQLYVYATRNVRPRRPDPFEGRAERLREAFREFGGTVPAVLERLGPDESIVHADIEEMRLARWTGLRAALLGDAAHAMSPNLGQGAAMAIEDAWVLAERLDRDHSMAVALYRYERARRARVDRVQRDARRFGRLGQLEWLPAVAARNRFIKRVPASATLTHMRWLLGGGPG